MAREEADREDLLRDATAYVERVAWQSPSGETWFVGFRGNGAVSFYFGADPVYHFNAAGELRRAYIDGLLYKAVRGKLVRMQRERSEHQVTLASADLTHAETSALLAQVEYHLGRLAAAIKRQERTLRGQIPLDADVPRRVGGWLEHRGKIRVAASPRASG